MLRQRLLTAAVLVAIVAAAVLYLPPAGFALFVALIILIGAWEWSTLLKLTRPARVAYLAVMAALMAALQSTSIDLLLPLMLVSALWWLVAFSLVLRYPDGGTWWQRRAVALGIGLLVLVPGFVALNALREMERYPLVIAGFIVLVAAADSFAYFTGRAFGRRRLAPRVSPNKSWEGVYGGMAGCVALGLVVLNWLVPPGEAGLSYWPTAVVGLVLLAAFSVVGDLFESMFKRHCQVKDSGNLLPGHGGVLDRLDSLTAALPIYVLILNTLGPL